MIRLATIHDVEQLVELEKESFTSCWKKEHFEYELLENPFSRLYCLEENNQLIGYAGIWITFETAQITTIAVKKEFRGKGLGKELLNHLINVAKEAMCELITLEVRISNDVAISLYQEDGFKINHIKEKYYQDNGEDAYYMIKYL